MYMYIHTYVCICAHIYTQVPLQLYLTPESRKPLNNPTSIYTSPAVDNSALPISQGYVKCIGVQDIEWTLLQKQSEDVVEGGKGPEGGGRGGKEVWEEDSGEGGGCTLVSKYSGEMYDEDVGDGNEVVLSIRAWLVSTSGILQCVAVCVAVSVAVWCSVFFLCGAVHSGVALSTSGMLQCVAVCFALHVAVYVAVCCAAHSGAARVYFVYVAVWRGVLQRIAACCSVCCSVCCRVCCIVLTYHSGIARVYLRCVAVCCTVLHCVWQCVDECVAVCFSVYCSVLRYHLGVARVCLRCCSVLQCVAVCVAVCTAVCVLQCVAL